MYSDYCCKSPSWCIYLKEFHFLLPSWTQRFWQICTALNNQYIDLNNSEFIKGTWGRGISKRRACRSTLGYVGLCKRAEPCCCLPASFNCYLEVTLSLVSTCAWGWIAQQLLSFEIQKSTKTVSSLSTLM